ncbi:MAG: exodeoxyribonuclease V subunit beta [Desulfobacteraceae bacterium]|nr:exodeoxyribonuclease V subunit beta [Desulfobacteraceae bacterium]
MAETLNSLTFPLHGTRLIEASAGTGKTYTIAALYLRLVLGHGGENGFSRPLTPPEILVVTFTNAATEELRERIRSRLTEAAAFFRGIGEGDDFLQGLRAEYDADLRPAKAMLLDQAAQWMDESAIHTIHAWCQRMLRQHAFDSLSLFDLELAPSDQDLLEEAACDFWRAGFYPQTVEVLAEFKDAAGITTPQELLKQAMPLVNAGKKNGANPFEMLEERRQAVEAARREWALDFQQAVDLVVQAQADKSLNNNKYRKPFMKKAISQLDLWVNGSGPLPETQVLEKFSTTGLAAGVSKKKNPPVHSAYDAFDRLNDFLESIDVKEALVSHAAAEINRRVIAAKARLSRMGFNDLLTRLGEALSRPESSRLAEVIRQQFPVAMIDEFQDTDPVQYSSFSTIYLDREDAGLFMIGDPKQAIYAFRGADIHTYLGAKNDTSERHYTLEKNYRSTQGMVDAVNRMFGRAGGFDHGAFLFKDDIPFDEVKAQGRSEGFMVEGKEACPVTLWRMDQDEPVVKTGPDGYLARMAETGASEIVRLLNLGRKMPCRAGFREEGGELVPLRPSDIAVLVRDGMEARAIRNALEKRRVRSVYLSDRESVFDSPEALSLLYLLRACSDPANDQVLRTALATQVLDLSNTDLDRLNSNELAWEEELERFKNFRNTWRSQGVLPMLRTLLAEFDVGARLLAKPFGERRLTNLLHLAEMIQAAAATLDGEQGVIRWLAGRIEDSGNGEDEAILRLESDQELVRVVTIHKSKGLEYPLVFLPFICSFRKLTSRNSPMVKFHDGKGEVQMVVNPGQEDLEQADRERLAEDLRMLYVALTRPRYACWLGIGVMGRTTKKSGETTDLHQSGLGYLLAGDEMIPTAGLSSILNDFRGDCDAITIKPLPEPSTDGVVSGPETPTLAQARAFTGHVPRNWRITSYSGILTGAAMPEHGAGVATLPDGVVDSPDSASQDQLQEEETQESAAPEVKINARSIHTFARGPEPGTFLHDILERAADHGFDRVAGDRDTTFKQVSQLCQRRGWEEWAEVLTGWLMELVRVELILPGPGGISMQTMKLSDLGPDLCRAELEFMFAVHGVDIPKLDRLVGESVLPGHVRPVLREDRVNGMLKGFIDLVFCFEGRYFVLDYKSNHLGDTEAAYGKEAMADAMLEHRYDLQYVLYTLALHRLLKARLGDYDYDRDVGGAVYLFLRGVNASGRGVYVDKPPKELINALDHLFQQGDNHDDHR